MTQISKNFKLSEFTSSITATNKGIDNTIPEEYIPNVRNLVINLLQPICNITGWHDQITSGYRSEELNKAVGGTPTSDHMKGRSSDNKFYKIVNGKKVYITPIEVLRVVSASNLEFDQMIAYPTFVHLSYRLGANRKQILYNKSYNGPKL